MTNKQLKLIYEYMGWNPKYVGFEKRLDSNSAWECVQEMERRGDWLEFSRNAWQDFGSIGVTYSQFILWLFNPDNFFTCFGKFLEVRNETI